MKRQPLNKRALLKFVAIIMAISIGILTGFPLYHINTQYIEDIGDFIANNTTWYALPAGGRLFYIIYPIPWILFLAGWYIFGFGLHRKSLIINGVKEGTIMWIYNSPFEGKGHIYDFYSILNGFREIEWSKIPRPISGDYLEDKIIIYYRTSFFQSFFEWHRIVTIKKSMANGIYKIWIDGQYQELIEHPFNPTLNFTIVVNDELYIKQELDILEFNKIHNETLRSIQKDNFTMTVSEPGVARKLITSSMMSISDDTRSKYFDLLTKEEQLKYVGDKVND